MAFTSNSRYGTVTNADPGNVLQRVLHEAITALLSWIVGTLQRKGNKNFLFNLYEFQKVESIFELLELNDEDRDELLQMDQAQLTDVAIFCNNYPSIEVRHELQASKVQT